MLKFSKVAPEQGHTYIKATEDELLIGPPPAVGSDEFWAEFAEVIAMQDKLPFYPGEILTGAALMDKIPNIDGMPDVSEMVHRDPPEQLGNLVFSWLESVGAERNYDIMSPEIEGDQSFSFMVGVKSMIIRAIELAHPYAFAAKWFYMHPRPEEVAHAVCHGKLQAPQHVRDLLNHRDIAGIYGDAGAFTTYMEGCPPHPSYVAMHASVAGIAYIFSKLYNLTPEQLREVQVAQMAWAWGRTAAGVHYASDNFGGLELGERAITAEFDTLLSGSVFCFDTFDLPAYTDWRSIYKEIAGA